MFVKSEIGMPQHTVIPRQTDRDSIPMTQNAQT